VILATTTTQKNVNRVLGAVSRLNGLLREQGPIEDTAKILVKESQLDKVIGETPDIRGLDPNGGFSPMLLTGTFAKAANAKYGDGEKPALKLTDLDLNMLKTVLVSASIRWSPTRTTPARARPPSPIQNPASATARASR